MLLVKVINIFMPRHPEVRSAEGSRGVPLIYPWILRRFSPQNDEKEMQYATI